MFLIPIDAFLTIYRKDGKKTAMRREKKEEGPRITQISLIEVPYNRYKRYIYVLPFYRNVYDEGKRGQSRMPLRSG